eukprot:CAMPEP_0195525494 /NCGR_PEP_ID=MMETSP0794_2-20130614/25986_1 /TAXON_ID=515487 /ORGANISM="Stephanopyxis turris, Strain CCMP 815" /LENGTH=366 /DNA_ID=CAMNT_0040655973 /DNA_START=254 /DNA_END=1354 /DNA_ORIENTATION=+
MPQPTLNPPATVWGIIEDKPIISLPEQYANTTVVKNEGKQIEPREFPSLIDTQQHPSQVNFPEGYSGEQQQVSVQTYCTSTKTRSTSINKPVPRSFSNFTTVSLVPRNSPHCNQMRKKHLGQDQALEKANDNSSSYSKSMPRPTGNEIKNIIIMGGPASGKGTQCELIVSKFNLVHISTGDMLRKSIEETTTPNAKIAKAYMDKGELVPDEIIIHMVKDRLSQKDCQTQGWLLDGFPRTRAQAEALCQVGIIPDAFLFLHVPDEVLIKRVTGRRLDPLTKKIYHLEFSPPPAGIEHRLTRRSDDTEEKMVSRLVQFHKNEEAVKSCYTDVMLEIDGSRSPDEVAKDIDTFVQRKVPMLLPLNNNLQ